MSQEQESVTIQELVEAGCHFGHTKRRWNPKMEPYIYGERDGIHILDLRQTVPMFDRALRLVTDVVSKGGRILFVGTKKQAQEVIKRNAEKCGQFYVNYRWLGGMLTNWKTVTKSIARLKSIEKTFATGEIDVFTKKERLSVERDLNKLKNVLGGIQDMKKYPDLIFIVDVIKEKLAVAEAQQLGIPVVAILDSNSPLQGVDYPIIGNDDALRSIELYCQKISSAVLRGIKKELQDDGVDIGEEEGLKIIEVENSKI